MAKKTVEDLDVYGKRVLVRVDFNVPMDDKGRITDDLRVATSIPTIRYLVKNGARTILLSHLGRPKGRNQSEFSLAHVAGRLKELLGKKILFIDDVVGEKALKAVTGMGNGDVLLLENVRFHKEETENDPGFAKKLASMGEIFVSDAFGSAHRAHVSNVGIARYLPSVCGFSMYKEIKTLDDMLSNPLRPFLAILGGAKVSDKIPVIENLLEKVDSLIIGGGMAYTFLKAKGYNVGNSVCEDEYMPLAKKIIIDADGRGIPLLLPSGIIMAESFKADAKARVFPVDRIPEGLTGMDIDDASIDSFKKEIRKAKTIVWNGPMGVFEFPQFSKGTKEIAKAVVATNAVSVVGGGDTSAAVRQMGFSDRITHISIGGGSFLEFLAGKKLPGIEVIENKSRKK